MPLTHQSPDGRFTLGSDGGVVLLYDRANPSAGPIGSWPNTPPGYAAALHQAAAIAGRPLTPIAALGVPWQGGWERPRRSAWTAWYLAPILLGVAGLIGYVIESDNASVCQSTLGEIARASDSSTNSQCVADVALHNGGGLVLLLAIVTIVVMVVVRATRR